MRLTIKAKKEIETLTGTEKPVFEFWAPNDGGYVRLESDGKSGTLGQQICYGGGFSGSTVSCSPSNFERVCRRWYRAYMRAATIAVPSGYTIILPTGPAGPGNNRGGEYDKDKKRRRQHHL